MLFGRVIGHFTWTCPDCNHINITRLTPFNSWLIHCKAANCKHKFSYGSILYRMKTGRHLPPADSILVYDGVWKSGGPVNKVICAACGDLIAEHRRVTEDHLKGESGEKPVLLKPRKQRHADLESSECAGNPVWANPNALRYPEQDTADSLNTEATVIDSE